MLSSMTVNYDDPDYLAGVVFERLVYGPHRYGRPDSGTPASLASITRDDLVAFHRTWFGANAILPVVGDVTTDEALPARSARWAAGTRPASAAAQAEPPPAATRRLVIDRPGAVQTEIAPRRCPRKHPTIWPSISRSRSWVARGNRLHRVLRSDRGLTYGASADLNALKDAGTIVAETDTRSETPGDVAADRGRDVAAARERVGERN